MNRRFAARSWLLPILPLALLVACGDVDPPSAAGETGTPAPATPVAEQPSPVAEQPSPVAEPTTDAVVVASETRQAAVTLAVLHSVASRDFHGLAGELATASEINPRWVGVARTTLTVVAASPWTDELVPAAETLLAALSALADALEADDLVAARAAAEATHDAEHDFIDAGYAWLRDAGPPDVADSGAAPLAVLAAIDVVDGVGFHDLAHDVATASEPNPRWGRSAERALIALGAVAWPAPLDDDAASLAVDIQAFLDALGADDLAAAGAVAEALHDGQHDLSEAAYDWLAATHPMVDQQDPALAFGCLLKAVDAVDAFGFHDLARDLALSPEVDPRIVPRLDNLLAVLNFEREDISVVAMAGTVAELRDALERGDLERGAALAEAVHDAQHDFSDHAVERMGGAHGH
jgi:hypothetical protein